MGEKWDGGKKDDRPVTVVMKVGMCCQGCANQVKQSVRNFCGVEDVKVDIERNKLTVKGKVDPTELVQTVEVNTQRKVELISPRPKKTEPAVCTVVLKIPLPCLRCEQKLRKVVSKIKGVDSVSIDGEEGLATIKGTMDVEKLAPYVEEKMKRSVEVHSFGSDGEEIEEPKVEVNKSDYYGYAPISSYYSPAMHHQVYHDPCYGIPVYNPGYGVPVYNPGYGVPVYNQGYVHPGYGQGYPNQGYVMEYSYPPPPLPPPSYENKLYMFDDENPRGCSIM